MAQGQDGIKKPADNTDGPVGIAAGKYLCGDIDMRIRGDGLWFYQGSPIGRKELSKLFASVLKRDDAGQYWLITPVETASIEVDDLPFTAVEMMVEGKGQHQQIRFRTNLDDFVTVDDDHPLGCNHDSVTGEPRPWVRVRDRLDARIVRAVFYDLVALGEERKRKDGEDFGVWSSGRFWPIGSLENEG
ncbi:MAG: DUF1285 domain-containing protein [Rhodospirillales bacterium]